MCYKSHLVWYILYKTQFISASSLLLWLMMAGSGCSTQCCYNVSQSNPRIDMQASQKPLLLPRTHIRVRIPPGLVYRRATEHGIKLRYNLHAIKSTLTKRTIQWFQCVHKCVHITPAHSEGLYLPIKKSWPLAISSVSPPATDLLAVWICLYDLPVENFAY